MADAMGIMEKIKKAAVDAQDAGKPMRVYFGNVVTASPLEIAVEQKMKLGMGQLILTQRVTDYEVTTAISDGPQTKEAGGAAAGTSAHAGRAAPDTRQIRVHNSLRAGEEVILLRQQEGQKFIVLDRIGGRR